MEHGPVPTITFIVVALTTLTLTDWESVIQQCELPTSTFDGFIQEDALDEIIICPKFADAFNPPMRTSPLGSVENIICD